MNSKMEPSVLLLIPQTFIEYLRQTQGPRVKRHRI